MTEDTIQKPTSPTTKNLERLAYSVKEFATLIGVSRASIWRQISEGKLPARRIGGRTIILITDAQAYLNALPMAPPKLQEGADHTTHGKTIERDGLAWEPPQCAPLSP